MTHNEALEFLELPESATKSQIKIRLVEKLEYFQHLSEHAASDFLRRIHAKNIDKVRNIQQEFFPWSSLESESEVVLPLEEEIEEEEIINTVPLITHTASPPASEEPVGPVAWLVTHIESQASKAFPLEAGNNYIGRKLQPAFIPFIAIEDDPYISRIHAVVFIDTEKPGQCTVMDSAESNNGQPSRNGTYINGNTSRITKNEILKENGTVQIGSTKLVFKSNTKTLRDILAEVEHSSYITTVDVN